MPHIADDHVCLLLFQQEEEKDDNDDAGGDGERERDEEGKGENVGEGENAGEGENVGEVEVEVEVESESWFYLYIPLDNIDPLCLSPRKYLLYIAWCILGLDADVESLELAIAGEDREFHAIDLDGDLEGGGIYKLIPDDPNAGMYFSVPHDRAVLIYCRHGCSGP